jgi:hypothetical protein
MENANETVNPKIIKIARSRTGIPCLWESSTDFSDLRRVTVVYNSDRTHKKALFTRKNSEKQALVPIAVGDYVSKAFEDRNGYALSIFEVTEISSMKNEATIIPVFRRSSMITERTWEGTTFEKMVEETIAKLDPENTVVYAQHEEASV